MKKILFFTDVVKGNFAFGNSLDFQAQIDDLSLKCWILEENYKNKTSGRTLRFWLKPVNKKSGELTLGHTPKNKDFYQ